MGKGEGHGEGSGEGGGAGKGGEISVNLSQQKPSTDLLLTSESVHDNGVVLVPTAVPKPVEKPPRFLVLRQYVHKWRPRSAAERCVCSALLGLVAAMLAVAGIMLLHQAGVLPLPRSPKLVFTQRLHVTPKLANSKENKPETWEAKAVPDSGKIKLGPTRVSKCKCVHRRMATAPIEGVVTAVDQQEIIHDTESRWSALVDDVLKKCLLFTPMSPDIDKCPSAYPWLMDRHMGALPCTYRPRPVPGGVMHYTSKVVRLVLNEPMKELNESGNAITERCNQFESYRVMAVFVSYYSQLRSIRSTTNVNKVEDKKEVEPARDSRTAKKLIERLGRSTAKTIMNEINPDKAEAYVFGKDLTTKDKADPEEPIIVETVKWEVGGANVDISAMDTMVVDP